MKKSFVLLMLIGSVAIFLFAFKDQQGPGWENLQVLSKNTTKKQMDSIMKHFSYSLGVNCDFCHVQMQNKQRDWDFASDTSDAKKVARQMMHMTMEINKKYFGEYYSASIISSGNAITCYSCHNGQVMPATFPPAKKTETKNTPPPFISPQGRKN